MDNQEGALHQVLVTAIRKTQEDRADVEGATVNAAKAFTAGLAAWNEEVTRKRL